jgi:hypothetical protein
MQQPSVIRHLWRGPAEPRTRPSAQDAAEREQAAEHQAAVRRILELAASVRDGDR